MSVTATENPTVAIVNDPTSGVDDNDLAKWVAALQKQVDDDFAPAWNKAAQLEHISQGYPPPANVWVIALLDTSDVAGALGYHDLTPDGLPLGKVFAGTDRQYNQQVPITLGHELLEMLGDPYINLSAQPSDGKFYAWETCDAVEADNLGYEIDGVPMTDFVYPAWFGNGPAGRLDHLTHASSPLQLLPGGYIGVFDPASGQGWQQVTARKDSHAPVDTVLAAARVGSRRERRFRGSGNWALSTYSAG